MEKEPKPTMREVVGDFEEKNKEKKLQEVTDKLCGFVSTFDVMEDSRPEYRTSVNAGFDDENYLSTLVVLDHQDIDDIALQIDGYVSEHVNPYLENFFYKTKIEGRVVVTQLQTKKGKLN